LRPSIQVAIVGAVTVRYALLDEIPGQARARLRLHGPDTRRFLQGTLTADLAAVRPGHAVAAGLCTVKGKLVCELVLLPGAGDDEVHALVPAERAAALLEHFDRHIVMDEVEVESLGPVGVAVAWDDGDEPPVVEAGAVEAFVTRHPAPGRLVVGTPQAVKAALAGYTAVGAEGFTAHRIATASPGWGHELHEGFFPPEVGFVHAVSYDKGCFLGQEPLARIHARGQVNRVMVRVHASRAPAGAVTLAAEDREDAGQWTTWAAGDEGVDGLAVVRRAVAEPGVRLRTAGEDPIAVEVRSGPLGDDPGLGGRGQTGTMKLGGRR
jgi:folate-binding protein YgfZ